MVVVMRRFEASLRQEYINSILRPEKQKFQRGKIIGARTAMHNYGIRKLRPYRSRPRVEYDYYYHFEKQKLVPNFEIPPLGRKIRVTDLKGEPIVLTRRKVQGGKFRLVYKKISFDEQRTAAFQLFDTSLDILVKHHENKTGGSLKHSIQTPTLEIPLRFREDFQSGNFSRFPDVWLLLLSLIDDTCPGLDCIDLTFGTPEEVAALEQLKLSERVDLYKKRIYGIIHRGYTILQDTHRNARGTVIDGELIRGIPILKFGHEIGFWPNCGSKTNSDYMSDYLDDFGLQIRKWISNESLIHLSQESELNRVLTPLQVFKTTIEPSKPRICLNARPLGAVLKKLPCKLDQAEELIPYLQPGHRVAISDDSSGFLHVFLSPEGQRLCGIHCGAELFAFRGLPFGIPSAPSVYQSLNNVISCVLRQFSVPNCLYIDDRALVIGPNEDYLSWVLPALCTSSGHFLSIHKSTLQKPASVFSFLGFEFDIEKQKVSVPLKRKEKIRSNIREILKHPICNFAELEKLRGKFCSLALVCPLTRLNIRAITHVLTLHESLLQPEVLLTPSVIDELNTWLSDPFFLDAERPFNKIGEKDIIFRPRITLPQGVVEYHTDASGYRLGCHEVSSGREWSRQLSPEEAQQYSIAVHEARALLFCVQNIELNAQSTRVLRIHCDNLQVVYAFHDYQGSRNPDIQRVIQALIKWQRHHQIEIEIIYVNTANNLADAPSRLLDHWEISANNKLLRVIEKQFNCCFTLDGASDYGVRRKDKENNFLPYVARYNDGGNDFLNFLSLDFQTLLGETIWLFPPKSQEGIFLQYFLSFSKRPRLVLLILQHQALPSIFNYAKSRSNAHIKLRDNNYLSRATKGNQARVAHPFQGLLHVFDFYAT